MFDTKNARDLFAFTSGAQADVAREACDEIERLVKDRDYIETIADKQAREFVIWLKEERAKTEAALAERDVKEEKT